MDKYFYFFSASCFSLLMCCRLSEQRTLVERLRRVAQLLLTFMFTQVGVIVLVASYTVAGAFIFQNIGSRRDILIVNYFTLHLLSI